MTQTHPRDHTGLSEQDWWEPLEQSKRAPGSVRRDWDYLLVFSDWAEENGNDLLAGVLRFMHANRRMPSTMTKDSSEPRPVTLPACWWPYEEGMTPHAIDTLPFYLAFKLRPTFDENITARAYPTVREAVYDLARVLQESDP